MANSSMVQIKITCHIYRSLKILASICTVHITQSPLFFILQHYQHFYDPCLAMELYSTSMFSQGIPQHSLGYPCLVFLLQISPQIVYFMLNLPWMSENHRGHCSGTPLHFICVIRYIGIVFPVCLLINSSALLGEV